MPIRVLIVDDHPVFLAGVVSLLESCPEIEVVGEAHNGEQAITLAREIKPDLVVMDINMPGMEGMEATKLILKDSHDTKVLALSMHSHKRYIDGMLQAGASGYLLKDSAPDELLTAIMDISEGKVYLSSGVVSKALNKDDIGKYNLLETKLHRPPLSDDHLFHKDLIDKLEGNRERPLTIISAPAGYGKSILASQWMENTKVPFAWISLDTELNDLRTFLIYMQEAISKILPRSLKKTKRLLQVTDLPPLDVIADTFLGELEGNPEEFILVLDDYHVIDNMDIHEFIDKVLSYPPECIHLCLITRTTPPIKLNRIMTQGRLTEIGTEDLSLSQNDITDLYRKQFDSTLSDDTARLLKEKTEGWVVGLQLILYAIKDEQDANRVLEQLDGNIYTITQFLTQEVLEKQTQEIKRLLLATSISSRFCSHLVDEVFLDFGPKTGDSLSGEKFIQSLQKNKLFLVGLDDENHWFRYNHFFQELLQQQLSQSPHAELIIEMHRRLSHWFERKNLIFESIEHAIKAGDPVHASGIIERHRIEQLEADKWYELARWLELIPQEIRIQQPGLLLTQAWICYERSQIVELIDILERTEEAHKKNALKQNLAAEYGFFKAYFAYFTGESSTGINLIEKSIQGLGQVGGYMLGEMELMLGISRQMSGMEKEAIKKLDERISSANRTDYVYLVRLSGGKTFIHMLRGNLHEGKRAFSQMQVFTERSRSTYAKYWNSYLGGWINFQSGNLAKALEGFQTTVDMQYLAYTMVIIDAYAGLALSQQLLGRWEKANELVGKMLDFAGTMDDAHCLAMAQSSQARIKLLQGDLSAALLWAQSLVMEPDLGSLFFWLENPWINKSRILLAEGSENNLEKAGELLQALKEISDKGNFICQQRDINILQALVFEKQGKSAEALELLKEELAISGQEGWRSHFLEAEALLDDLLHALHDKDSSNEFLQAIMEERTISRSKLTASTKSTSSH